MTSARDRVFFGGQHIRERLGCTGCVCRAELGWADWLCVSVCVALPAICPVAHSSAFIPSIRQPCLPKRRHGSKLWVSCWQVTTCIDSERLTMRNQST